MNLKVNKDQVLEAAKTSPQAKKALEKLFPSVFEDNRVFCRIGSVFLRSSCPNNFYTVITQNKMIRVLNITYNTFWKSADQLNFKCKDLKLWEEGAITHTEMQKILGVKDLKEYRVITTKDVVMLKDCGGGYGKKVPEGDRFCSPECSYAWAFD